MGLLREALRGASRGVGLINRTARNFSQPKVILKILALKDKFKYNLAMSRWNTIPARANKEEALRLGLKNYQGYPCRKGHAGIRLASCGQCEDCYEAKLAKRKYLYGKRCRHPAYELLKEAKKRAKQYNRDFDLELEDIYISECCPISGKPMIKHTPDAPSLDRIDNSKGYTKDNVMVISWRMNVAKSGLTPDEARKLADFMALLS